MTTLYKGSHYSKIEEELYQILADYSNDLHSLKKRNGRQPATAAVARLQTLIEQSNLRARLEEIELAESYLPQSLIDPDHALERKAQIEKELETNK